MKTYTRFISLLLTAILLISVAACVSGQPDGNTPGTSSGGSGNAADPGDAGLGSAADQGNAAPGDAADPGSAADAVQAPAQTSVEVGQDVRQAVTIDREGNQISLPGKIGKIISMGPSNTEILVALGFVDMIIAIDEYSDNVEGLKPGTPMFSMMQPDGEQIISMMPDVIFVTGMSKAGGDDPFKVIEDAGICLVYIPSSVSLGAIMEDIRFIAAVMGAQAEGEAIIEAMEKEIEDVRAIGQTISVKKKVYFEISAAPWMYSFGSGVFLDEMISLIGAVNILGDQDSWVSVADEIVLAADPDVILTSVDYIDDPVGEILSRPGWSGITAVRNGDVYYISADASNRPSHNVVIALLQMAKAVYPEFY